ncbi:thiol:disulfide interchange protein DsbD [Chitinimonas prasina]|uniref:Thiol:disulfide interchange protein DsbD n=1 Tax=Chitinimonas prasina TaxID=1434937 RepID=A0ABQ5YK44_9NEIS|nr:protein-disulfide reductase DsbD [Chitinimonas prasina]GLR13651.1 thiol:disulfide interchange protein DsbD [Chitinimonas prasina]
MNRFVSLLATGFLALWVNVAANAEVDPNDLLPVNEAFKPSLVKTGEKTANLHFEIADGYYLYRDQLKFTLLPSGEIKAEIPPGKKKQDDYFGEVETYRLALDIPLTSPVAFPPDAKLKLVSQGCADVGVCYPPETTELSLAGAVSGSAPAVGSKAVAAVLGAAAPAAASAAVSGPFAGLDGWTLLLAFYLAGLGMAATVCMYPLIPIISSLIVGQGHSVGKLRGFVLAMAYVQGIAVVYAAVGAVAALTGSFLVAALQNMWVISALALVFVVLALSMYGLFSLQLPAALQSRVNDASNRLGGGHVVSVFLMGALSSLIVGACMGPPLAAGLGVVGARADVLYGMLAFYVMAMGVGTPLLLVGVLGGHVLPKAGAWMAAVKNVFGTLMLAVALWIASPVLPAWAYMLGWAMLAIGAGVALSALDSLPRDAKPAQRLGKAAGVLLLLVGAAQIVGLLAGNRDPLQPLKGLGGAQAATEAKLPFRYVNSSAELDAAIAAAAGKTVMLDFYADWCVSCREMERFTFSDAQVQQKLAGMVLLKADVTANTEDHKALLKRFGLFGPPGTIFFGAKGEEIGQRLIGFEAADAFLQRIAKLN